MLGNTFWSFDHYLKMLQVRCRDWGKQATPRRGKILPDRENPAHSFREKSEPIRAGFLTDNAKIRGFSKNTSAINRGDYA